METAIVNYMDNILLLFLGNDPVKEWMMQPNVQDGCVYATDGHIFFKAPVDRFEQVYGKHEKMGAFKRLYDQYEISTEPIDISVSQLKSILLDIEKVSSKEKCPECEGDGYVICNYDHRHKCENCKEKGVVINHKVKIYPKDDHFFKIKEAHLCPYYIHKLIAACDIAKINTMKLISYGEVKANLFRSGNIDICIMPINLHNYDDWKDKIIHVYPLNS